MFPICIKEIYMVNQKQNFTKEEEDILAAAAVTLLFIFLKLGILGFLIYIILKIYFIVRP